MTGTRPSKLQYKVLAKLMNMHILCLKYILMAAEHVQQCNRVPEAAAGCGSSFSELAHTGCYQDFYSARAGYLIL